MARDLRTDGQPELHGHADGLAIQHGQHARIAEVDQIGLGVRRGAVSRGGGREDLGPGRELRVDLEPDDRFPPAVFLCRRAHRYAPGTRVCQSVSF